MCKVSNSVLTLAHTQSLITRQALVFSGEQANDIVYVHGNVVKSASRPGGGEAPKGSAVRR